MIAGQKKIVRITREPVEDVSPEDDVLSIQRASLVLLSDIRSDVRFFKRLIMVSIFLTALVFVLTAAFAISSAVVGR